MSAYFGLDIGSTSIKLLQSDGNRVKLLAIANNPSGKNIGAMNNAEKIALTDILKTLVHDTGLREKKVVTSISESLVFSRVLKFPVMSTPELATAIKWELDQSVPFPPNDVETSWSIIEKPEKFTGEEKVAVYVVAVPSGISDTYMQILDLVGLEPVRLENEVPALVRGFNKILSSDVATIILELGASGTNIVAAGKDTVFENYYMPVGGLAITRLIAEAFGLPLAQAENYKRTYGINKDQLEGKMFTVVKPVIDNIIGEVKKMAISYSNSHKDKNITRLVVTGGGSYLLGLIPYLSGALEGMEVVSGDVFSDLQVDQKYKGLGPVFSVAYGLSA